MTKGIDLPAEEVQKMICKYIPVEVTEIIGDYNPISGRYDNVPSE